MNRFIELVPWQPEFVGCEFRNGYKIFVYLVQIFKNYIKSEGIQFNRRSMDFKEFVLVDKILKIIGVQKICNKKQKTLILLTYIDHYYTSCLTLPIIFFTFTLIYITPYYLLHIYINLYYFIKASIFCMIILSRRIYMHWVTC